MKIDYQVNVQKFSKYTGKEPNENFPYNEIVDETYLYTYAEFSKALDHYKESCKDSASSISVPICFQITHKIQLLSFEVNGKRKIMYQFNCSSL